MRARIIHLAGAWRHAAQFTRALAVAIAIPSSATGIDSFGLEANRIAGTNWAIDGVRISLSLNATPSARIQVKEINAVGQRLTDVSIACGRIELGQRLTCSDAELRLDLPGFGSRRASGTLTWDRQHGTIDTEFYLARFAGGGAQLSGRWTPEGWEGSAELSGLNAKTLIGMLPEGAAGGWSLTGQIDARIEAHSDGGGIATHGRILTSGMDFSDTAGLHAGEALNGAFSWRLQHDHQGYRGELSLRGDGGQLYIDPVFVDLGEAPLRIDADGAVAPQLERFELNHARLAQRGIITATGDATLSSIAPYVRQAHVSRLEASLPQAFTTWLKPFLVGSGYGELGTAGTITAEARVSDDLPKSITLDWRNGSLSRGGLALRGLDATLGWTAKGLEPAPTSRIQWRGGELSGVTLGPARVRLALDDRALVLAEPLALPLLNGSLRVTTLGLHDLGRKALRAELDARLQGLSLDALSKALGWPPLSGTLDGRLPRLGYRDGTVTLGGELSLNAFDGTVRVKGLRLTDPFGQVPVLEATGRLRGLDLRRVTQAFSFGRITGRLDGDIDDLRLVGWRPASFRAWFRTPKGDQSTHRISQRAVENLTSLGGGGASGALSRGVLRFFDDFAYDRLGLGCALTGNTCVMRGLEATEAGYIIVRGASLPRINVIGYTRRVSWPTLVEQLVSVTRNREAVVK